MTMERRTSIHVLGERRQNPNLPRAAIIPSTLLVIAVLTNFYIGTMIIGSDNSWMIMNLTSYYASSYTPMKVHKPKFTACVKREENKCQLYPCEKKNGTMTAIELPEHPFGYAGRFVHRDRNVTRQPMQTGGLKNLCTFMF